jgi:hypothetical protein
LDAHCNPKSTAGDGRPSPIPSDHDMPAGSSDSTIPEPPEWDQGSLEARLARGRWYLSEVMKENAEIRKELAELSDRLFKNSLIVENVMRKLMKR